MKKALLAGIVGLVIGGGIAVPSIAQAHYTYNQDSCDGTTLVTVAGGSIHGPSHDQIVCADGFLTATAGAIDGGAISAAPPASNGPTRVCVGSTPVTTPVPVGTYVIIDGDRRNAGGLSGYIGVSNFESSNSNENCTQGNNGSGTNSGGAVGPDNGPNAPVPFIVCGFLSGPDYGNTGRDGCYIP